ncbi:melanoma-associated antigen B16-like [Cervus elaphus]|uniref:melanoma-associated antigen B16-like n=1 Tax=Cervus canadensis TaxID=1574408 RepID=UPI001CA33A46|nr:melanoma-associated antigen B16-like [Cervus canadensis]XP_043753624.1 melanoma-associated antigen B16-like [Cervus elaphus]
MPRHQKHPHHSRGKHRKTFYKSYGWEVARVSRALKETNTAFQFLMPGDFPGTPESYQSFYSSVATTATFLIQSDEFSTSQNVGYSLNTSQVVSYPVSMPIDPLNEEVALLVNFLLLKYQMKQPVTKADMMNVAIYKCEVHFPEILRRASECMGMLFGLDLKEVDPTNHCYVLFIKLGLTYDGMMHGEAGVPKTGILILILGVIFMKGNCATEDEVWEVLNVTRMCSRRKYFFFGELKQLITEDFVREGYLEFRQVASEGPVQSVFLWGPRAHAETTKMKILEFLAKVNGTDPSYFPFKYEEALQDENAKAQARISANCVCYYKFLY